MQKPTITVEYYKLKNSLRGKTVHSWYTYVLLIGFYICYLLFGAFMFQYFEEKYEVSRYYVQ